MGEAMMATGRASEGRDLIKQAWIDSDFEPDEEVALIQKHGDLFTPDVDRQRLNRLLWRDDLSAARREMARVTAPDQQLAECAADIAAQSAFGRAPDRGAAG